MKRLFCALTTLTLAACGLDAGDQFRKGLPTSDSVKITVPSSSGQGLTGSSTQALEGDQSVFYTVTRGVTVVVNGSTALVLDLVANIVKYPPTSTTQDTAVWGPHTDPLSPNTYKLTVTRTSTDHYTYSLEGKGKTEADSAYRVLLSGTHVSAGTNLGKGSFLLDFDKAHELPEHGADVGTAQVDYEHMTLSGSVSVNASFTQVNDADTNTRIDAKYQYAQTPGQGGTFDYTTNKNVVTGPGIESLTIRSRWQDSGAGRSDVKASGGDLTADATANECWDTNFASRYMNTSFDSTQKWGVESACAFPAAEYSSL